MERVEERRINRFPKWPYGRTYVQNALLNDRVHDDADQGVEAEHAQISDAIGVVDRRRRIEDARGVVAQGDEDAGQWLGALFAF